eukprot:TRINITY_DN45009_c0_g1_i1.p1 TRINITY_DN45009_c0_g1~~TRINITY_DN45009_c0_g1_i1.p1  ORF type:complete len:993 (-),score=134.51 TRINITY_DN45009_c0_g1_i1:192-3170(-)
MPKRGPATKAKVRVKRGSNDRPAPASRDRPASGQSPSPALASLQDQDKQLLKDRFNALDKDGDGTLDLSELQGLLKCGSRNGMTDNEVRVLFNKLDRSKDGRVDFEEFVEYIFSTEKCGTLNKADVEFEAELPLGGGRLQLGGTLGHAVIKVGDVQKVKIGWRAIAINGNYLKPVALAERLNLLNSRSQRVRLTFDIDEHTMDKMANTMVSRREKARRELLALLKLPDWSHIRNMTAEQRDEALKDRRCLVLLAQAHAVGEAELMLGNASEAELDRRSKLVSAVEKDDSSEVASVVASMGREELLRKDGDGNAALHLCRSPTVAETILAKAPEAAEIINNNGRNALNEQCVRNPVAVRPIFEMLSEKGRHDRSMLKVLLTMDKGNVCPAMRLCGRDLEKALLLLPGWEAVSEALGKSASEIIPALHHIAGEMWPGLLSFHCFRDLVHDGCFSGPSWGRLRTVWQTLRELLAQCLKRMTEALEPAKTLLRATKGPCCPPIDTRLPYRQELAEMMKELNRKSADLLARDYDSLEGPTARWLTNGLQTSLSDKLVPDVLVEKGVRQRLRMDFQLADGEKASEVLVPAWASETAIDLRNIVDDLKRVGMVGQNGDVNMVHETLFLAGMNEESDSGAFGGDAASMTIARLYGAYLRGLCQTQQAQIRWGVRSALGNAAVPGETFFARESAKGFPRIMVKALQEVEEIYAEAKALRIDLRGDLLVFLQRAAGYICDINGITIVSENPQELQKVHETITSSFKVLRTKNTYRADTPSESGYRDVKLWPFVQTDVGPLLVEVQLLLQSSYQEKKWMHLPYSFTRGDFDWDYLTDEECAEDKFRAGWRSYTGIEGTQRDADMLKAREALEYAAKQGLFMARGICYKEGWGNYPKDDVKALHDFVAAAELGRPEGKTRVGVSFMNAVSNVMVNRSKGLKLLEEAAQVGELEAMYQLGIHAVDVDEQRAWLRRASRHGHMKAAKSSLVAGNSRFGRHLGSLVD